MKQGTRLLDRAPLVLLAVFAALALTGTASYFIQGKPNSGDLYPHYAAGRLWAAGEHHALYRGNILGQRVDAWQQERFPESGEAPRDHFNYLYPPLCAMLAARLSEYPFQAWAWIWPVLSLVFYAASCLLLVPALTGPANRSLGCLATLAFPPLHYALYIGQLSPLTLLVASAACLLLARGRPLCAGAVMSLVFYKPQLLPWLGLFMLFCGHWRFTLAAAAGSATWLVLGVVLAGVQAHLDWLACLGEMASGLQSMRLGVNLSLRGVLETLAGGHARWIDLLSMVAGVALLAGVAKFVRQYRHLTPASDPAGALALGLAASLLASPYVCHYDFLLAVPWMLAVTTSRGATLGWSLILFWLAGLLSIAGLLAGWPYAGLLLALWWAWTVRKPWVAVPVSQ
ncbi:MAG: glycosyltransferase family 87 protein [Candidatus Methylacidiphilales bacterium]|nr:glycosyltransferase family 87 protein [Candidatus Methylacidiphilales bacterium]